MDSDDDSFDHLPVRLADLRTEQAKRATVAREAVLAWPSSSSSSSFTSTRRVTEPSSVLHDTDNDDRGGRVAGASILSSPSRIGRGQLAETRQRLSRLLGREKLLRSKNQTISQPDPPPALRSPMAMRQTLRETRSLITRSLSPSPRKSKTQTAVLPRQYKLQPHQVQNFDNSVLDEFSSTVRKLDAPALKDISDALAAQSRRVLEASNLDVLRECFAVAQTDLAVFSVSQVQLWVENCGYLESAPGGNPVGVGIGVAATISPETVADLMGAVRAQGRFSSTPRGEMVLPPETLTIHPDEPLWKELEGAIRMAGSVASQQVWHSIHVVTISHSSSKTIAGALLIAESYAASVPLTAMNHRTYRSSTAQLKSSYLLECLERLALAVSFRLYQIGSEADISGLQSQLLGAEEEISQQNHRFAFAKQMEQVQDVNQAAILIAKFACSIEVQDLHCWVLFPPAVKASSHLHLQSPDLDALKVFGCQNEVGIESIVDGMLIRPSSFTNKLVANASSSVSSLIVTYDELEVAGLVRPEQNDSDFGKSRDMQIVYFALGCQPRCIIALGVPARDRNEISAIIYSHANTISSFASDSLKIVVEKQFQALSGSMQTIPSILWSTLASTASRRGESGVLHKICRVLESKAIAECFQTRSIKFLMTDTFASSLKICPVPAARTARFWSCSLSSSSQEAFTQVLSDALPISSLPWMQDLMEERPVRFSRSEDAYMSDANRLLQDLVLATNPETLSCTLIPLKTPDGLCLLVLSDEVKGEVGQTGTIDLSRVLENSNLLPDLVAAVATTAKLHAAELELLEGRRREAQIEAITALLQKQIIKTQAARFFSTWKQNLDSVKAENSNALLSTAMDLLSPDQATMGGGDWGRGSFKNFLLAVEKHIGRLFPTDSISVMSGLLASIAAPQGEQDFAVLMTADTSGPTVSYSVSTSVRNDGAPVLVGFIRGSISTSGNDDDESSHPILGTIRIIRSRGAGASNSAFTSKDTTLLSRVCRIASTVYLALRRGLQAPKTEGDAKGLLLPFMSRLLPFLLEGPRRDADSLRGMMPMLAQFVKLICGGDVALLRIRAPEIDRKDLLVSSEDYSERLSVPQFLDRLGSNAMREASEGYITNASHALASSEGNGDEAESDAYAQIVIKLHEPDNSVIGELKVLGPQSPEGFNADQLAAAQLISYILSHSLSTAYRLSKSDASLQQAREIMGKAEVALDDRKQDLDVERGTGAALRKRLSSALSMVLFMRQASESGTIASLASAVAESFPLVVGSRNAVLLLHSDIVKERWASDLEGGGDGEEKTQSDVKPSEGLFAAARTSSGSDMQVQEFVSFAELANVPPFSSGSHTSQSKILLSRPTNGAETAVIYGAVLIFGKKNEDDPMPWTGLEDVLVTGLAGAVEACLDTVRASRLKVLLEDSHQTNTELQEDLQRERAWKLQHDIVVEQMRTALEKVDDLTTERVQLKSAHDVKIAKMQESFDALQTELSEVEEHREATALTRDALISLVEAFSFDHRTHQETIPVWLNNYAAGKDSAMLMITQSDDGTLSGAVEEIRGVTGAAGEALRTGTPIFIHSSVTSSSTLLRRWPTLQKEESTPASKNIGVAIFCVPNKCVSLETKCDHACYIYLRPAYSKAESFTEHEKTLLVQASNLASRLMMRTTSKYSVDELRAMELEIERERALVAKIRHAVLSGEILLRRPSRALADVGKEIEAGVVDLLSRGDHDSCSVQCKALLLPPDCRKSNWHEIVFDLQSRKDIPQHEIDLIQRACQAGSRGFRKAGTMWTPLKASDGQILAILRTERKLTSDLPLRSALSSVSSTDSYNAINNPPQPSLADLIITEEEEEAVGIFARQAAGHMVRVAANLEADESMDQAGKAMSQLHLTITSLEEKLQKEAGSRVGLESTLRAGIELLGACCSKRFTIEQLLDTARKSLLTITASSECFIVLPRIISVFPVPQSLSEVIADGFYCLEVDRAQALRVRFDSSDMEFRSLQSSRAACAPGPVENFGGSGLESGQVSNSWAARRFLGQSMDGKEEGEICALTVPFVLQDGSLAVISAVRNLSRGLYSHAEKDCVAWVAKVLAYCLEMICGKGSIKEGHSKVALLEAEIVRLKQQEESLEGLRLDCSTLLEDLVTPVTAATASLTLELSEKSDLSYLVTESAHLVFPGLQISYQSAAEAGQSVETLPWEAAEGAIHLGRLDSDSRGIVESQAGKATYWVGKRGEGVPTLVVLINHRAYPTSWLNISYPSVGHGKQSGHGSTSLRVAMLLRLLDCQESWCALRSNSFQEVLHITQRYEKQSELVASLRQAGRSSLVALSSTLHCVQEFHSLAQAFAVGKETEIEKWLPAAVLSLGAILASTEFELAVATGEPNDSKLVWFLSQKTTPWTLAGSDFYPVKNALTTSQVAVIGPDLEAAVHSPEQEAAMAKQCEAIEEGVREAEAFLDLNPAQVFQVMPLQSPFFHPGSIIVPVRFNDSTSDKNLLVILRRKRATRVGEASYVASTLVSALSLGNCLRDAIGAACKHRAALTTCRKLAISRSTSARAFIERHRSFALLKENMLNKKLSSALAKCDDFVVVKKKVRQLDQSLADWAEMVRGINGASTGISQGISGLWTHACRCLMSMVSSHLTLRGCGLLVENTSGEVVEYAVRGLGTPNARHHTSDDSPMSEGDYARGALDCRPVSELGGEVAGLAAELLQTGPYTQGQGYFSTRAYPRIHKLASRGEYDDEQTWLVPVRTSRSVLAVLRVVVVGPRGLSNSLTSPGAALRTSEFDSTPSSPTRIRFADEMSPLGASVGPTLHSIDDNDKGETESVASGAMSNAASIMSGTSGDESRSETTQMIVLNFAELLAPLISAAKSLDLAAINASQQDNEFGRISMRAGALTEELSLLSSALGVVSDFAAREDIGLSAFSTEALVRQLSEALGSALGGGVSMSLGASSGLGAIEVVYANIGGGSHSSVSETIADKEGRVLGRLLVSIPCDREDDSNVHPNQLRITTSVLKPLCRAISSLFRSLGRHRGANLELADKRLISSKVPGLEEELLRSRALVSVVQQCVSCIRPSSAELSTTTSDVEMIEDSSISLLLKGLCSTVPPMLCKTSTQVSFALLEESLMISIETSQAQQIPSTQSNLEWVFADGESNLLDGSREITENLARACISRRLKSAVDVNAGTTATTVDSAVRIRVLSYPLLSSAGAIGVLQVLTREDVPLGGVADGICEVTAEAVSCVVATHRQRKAARDKLSETESTLLGKLSETESSLRELAFRLTGAEDSLQKWHSTAESWRGVAAAASVIVQGFSMGRALPDVVSSGVAEPLRESGLSVLVRVRSDTVQADGPFVEESQMTTLVPIGFSLNALGGQSDLLAEICCTPSLLGDEDLATDLVETLRAVIASVSQSLRAQEIQRDAHRNDLAAAAQATQTLSDELRLTSERCEEQTREILLHGKQINFSLSSMSSFCGPTIREIAVMLEEIGTGRRLEVSEEGAREGSVVEGEDHTMDWAWDGLARVADRALSRISDRAFGYHASILVRSIPKDAKSSSTQSGNRAITAQPSQDIVVRMFDSSRRRESITISNNRGPKSARLGVLSDPAVCTLEKALLTGGVHENLNSLSQTDLIGIEKQALSAVFDAADVKSRVQVLCVAMPDAPEGMSAVLRVVFPSAPVEGGSTGASTSTESGGRSMVRPVMEMVMSLGCAVILISGHLTKNHKAVKSAMSEKQKAVADMERGQEQLARARRLHKVVCREACALLDPPLVGPGGQAPRAVHPASLTPLAASQDACTKLLAMSRSLLRGEGQALLMRDPTTDPVSFQVIFSGNALTWAGVDQGSFGMASSARQLSLSEAAMHSHKPVAVDDGPNDPRYCAIIDGACDAGSPMLFVPIRGRGSAVIGCLISTRGRGGSAYTSEDIAAAEIVSSHGSLTLYWCQGLGSLHHILTRNVTKMEELEKAVSSLSTAQARQLEPSSSRHSGADRKR